MPEEAIAQQDRECHSFKLHDNAISGIHGNTPIRFLRDISMADNHYLWVSFEPVNDDQATYMYLSFSFDFLQELGVISEDKLKLQDQIGMLIELIGNNEFIISYLRWEYYNYLAETKNTRFERIGSLKWLSRVAYSLVYYLNEISMPDDSESNVSRLDKINMLKLEAELSNRLDLATPELKDMASSVNMSASKFLTVFKEIFNETPHQYFLKRKLEKAVELLQTRNYSLSEVAYRLGFSHPSGLTRLFKSKMGATPTSLFESKE